MYTAESVRRELGSPAFLQHCVVLLNSQQLEVEREWGASVIRNGRGLSAVDAPYFAYLMRVPLIPETMPKVIRKTARYARQLAELLNAEAVLPEPLSQPQPEPALVAA